MLTKFINIPIFILSLAIGLFFVYIWGPEIKTIYVYPTPDNVGKVQYPVTCPSDASKISTVPIQTGPVSSLNL